jgi:putative flavoprotein involved in K+ transport
MPEMHFRIEWPNGKNEDCYSPSYVIEEYLTVGSSYPVEEFVARVRTALEIASERVQARYGFACSSALDQLAAVQRTAAELSPEQRGRDVRVLAFIKHPARDARGRSSPAEHHTVIVVGGGQAGLAVSYCLKQRGIDHVVLEANRVAHSWRSERWDTFCLVTPNWQCQLPGHAYAGPDPQGFLLKDEIVDYVESYASKFELPVREHVRVHSLEQDSAGRFVLETSRGRFSAEQVVVATGCYHAPRIPGYAGEVPQRIVQLHSSNYRNPGSLPAGDVLVVGTGQSGCQIAEDLHLEGRRVHLAVGNAPRCARRYRGKDVVEWLDQLGYYDIPIDSHPNREVVRDKTNHYVTGRDGGRDIDLRQLALEGMRLYGPLASIQAGRAAFEAGLKENLDAADAVYNSINRTIDAFIEKNAIAAPPASDYVPVWQPTTAVRELDLESAGISAIVWCTGFSSDFGWVRLPVLDRDGFPRHERGVTEVPGLFVIGLPWLYTWGSGRFSGVGRDAGYLAERIDERVPATRLLDAGVELRAT